tara:strand:+ start:558 stop:749 length:192 start_codon:yes stop_codon:yes gene_type:complete
MSAIPPTATAISRWSLAMVTMSARRSDIFWAMRAANLACATVALDFLRMVLMEGVRLALMKDS